MNTPFFRAVLAIIEKDLRAELRSRELLSTMLLFALLSVLIFSFALELDRVARTEAISGVVWVTVVFSSVLGLNRSMTLEREQSGMDAMLLAPISRTAVYAGKAAANFVFALAVGVALLLLASFLFNVPAFTGWTLLVLLVGTFGFSAVGTLLAAMTVQTRARESLLPIVMMPMALPLLLAAVRATNDILAGAPAEQWLPWIQMLAAVDVIYLALCLLTFSYVVEE